MLILPGRSCQSFISLPVLYQLFNAPLHDVYVYGFCGDQGLMLKPLFSEFHS